MRSALRLSVLFLSLCLLPVSARAAVLSNVDGMTSTVFQEGQSSFSGLALRVGIHPQRLIGQLEVLPTVEYWRNSNSVRPYGIETMRKDGTLGVDVRYNFSDHGWRPYLGMGFGVHFLSARVDAPTLGIVDASDSVIKGGLAALGGVSFGLSGRLDNFLELKYHHIPDYRQLKFNWGLSYRL